MTTAAKWRMLHDWLTAMLGICLFVGLWYVSVNEARDAQAQYDRYNAKMEHYASWLQEHPDAPVRDLTR